MNKRSLFAMVASLVAALPPTAFHAPDPVGPSNDDSGPQIPTVRPEDHRFRPVKLGQCNGHWSGPNGCNRDPEDGTNPATDAKRARKRAAWTAWLARAA